MPCTACTFTFVVSCLPSPTLFKSDSAALKRRSSPLSGTGLSIVLTRRVAALNAFIDSTFCVRLIISSASELRNHVTDPFAYPALRAASVTFPPLSKRFQETALVVVLFHVLCLVVLGVDLSQRYALGCI